MLSTLLGNTYGSYSGTSMVMPHVADVAALIKSQNIALDDAQIKSTLLSSVDEKTDQGGRVLTSGRRNAARHRTVSDGVAGQLSADHQPRVASLRQHRP